MPLGAAPEPEESGRERAFLVGLDVRSRRRAGGSKAVTAQAQAARDAALAAPAVGGKADAKSSAKPSIPEFDAQESLADVRPHDLAPITVSDPGPLGDLA